MTLLKYICPEKVEVISVPQTEQENTKIQPIRFKGGHLIFTPTSSGNFQHKIPCFGIIFGIISKQIDIVPHFTELFRIST